MLTRRMALAASLLPVLAAQHGTPTLPLGDGQVSAAPGVGQVYACPFPKLDTGALRDGPWIQDGRWAPGQKPTVDGVVRWPNARISVTLRGDRCLVVANNLPSHPTGAFPIAPLGPAACQ